MQKQARSYTQMKYRAKLPLAELLLASLCFASLPNAVFANTVSPAPTTMEGGYARLYNLDFAGAHAIFREWQHTHPDDPLGPASDAAAYLFAELDRLHILESDFFVDDGNFVKRSKPAADPAVKGLFDSQVATAEALAQKALAHSSSDENAAFAEILCDGLRGDYASLVEKRNVAGLEYMKSGRALAEHLLARNPAYYDAYLAVGIENYLLGLSSAPVRWVLRLG